jgi:hypothetical protein
VLNSKSRDSSPAHNLTRVQEKVKNTRANLLKCDSKIFPNQSGGGSKNTININHLNIKVDRPAIRTTAKKRDSNESGKSIKRRKEDLTPSQSCSSYHSSDEEFEADTERKLVNMKNFQPRKSFKQGVNKVIDVLKDENKIEKKKRGSIF